MGDILWEKLNKKLIEPPHDKTNNVAVCPA